MIFIKVLDTLNHPVKGKTVRIASTGMKGSSSHSTGADGVVQFNMDPGNIGSLLAASTLSRNTWIKQTIHFT